MRNSTLAHYRYKMVKKWLHRVKKFKSESKTIAEIQAWSKVEQWMKTILENKYLSKEGTICLPNNCDE